MTSKTSLILMIFFITSNMCACHPEGDLFHTIKNEISTNDREETTSKNMTKIKITVGKSILFATMSNNETAKDFISLLPLKITLEDYANMEKIYYLSRKLITKGAASGMDPEPGDITYYAPWGNLAIFYKDYGYATGLIRLGKIEGDMEALKAAGSMEATIELAK